MLLEEDRYRSKAELLKIKKFQLAEFSHLKEDEQGNNILFFSEQRKVLHQSCQPLFKAMVKSGKSQVYIS